MKIAHILIEKRRNYMKTSRGYKTKRSQEKNGKKLEVISEIQEIQGEYIPQCTKANTE